MRKLTFVMSSGLLSCSLGSLFAQVADFEVSPNFGAKYPSVAVNEHGNCIIIWHGTPGGHSGSGLYGQRFSGERAERIGEQFYINESVTVSSDYPGFSVASDELGNFAVTWVNTDGRPYYRNFLTDASPLSAPKLVTDRDDYCVWPRIAMLSQGEFIIAWHTIIGAPPSTQGNLSARLFMASGEPAGNEFEVESSSRSSYSRSHPSTFVRIEIYDLLGKLVRVLLSEEKPLGNHSVSWDGRDFNGRRSPSGVYIYRLKSNHLITSRKMLLLK